jgi:hypothetical protein
MPIKQKLIELMDIEQIDRFISGVRIRALFGKTSSTKTSKRLSLQSETRYYLIEARRALAFAAKDNILRDKQSYANWVENAIELLQEAERCRKEALLVPWSK